MTTPLATVYVDLVGPPVSAAWLNAVGQTLNNTPTTFTATSGQTVFTVSATASNLVYINGVFQILGSSFNRTNDVTITFTSGVPVTALVTVL